jgi:hypothetical protein
MPILRRCFIQEIESNIRRISKIRARTAPLRKLLINLNAPHSEIRLAEFSIADLLHFAAGVKYVFALLPCYDMKDTR